MLRTTDIKVKKSCSYFHRFCQAWLNLRLFGFRIEPIFATANLPQKWLQLQKFFLSYDVNIPYLNYIKTQNFLQVYENEKLIVIYSKSTDHSACPKKHKNFRVADYWSVLTIKPFQEFDKLGIEFSLTAYENPGKRTVIFVLREPIYDIQILSFFFVFVMCLDGLGFTPT